MVVFSQELNSKSQFLCRMAIQNHLSPPVFSYGLQTNNQGLKGLKILGNTIFETSVCNRGKLQVSTCAMKKGVD